MAQGRRIAGTVLVLLLCGCQGTIILKPPQSDPAPDPAPAPASSEAAAATVVAAPEAAPPAPAETSAEPSGKPSGKPPPEAAAAPVSREVVTAQPAVVSPPEPPVPAPNTSAAIGTPPVIATPPPAGGQSVPVAASGASRAPLPTTFMDRVRSGLHTGTVGAAFGGVGGPIGLAAGGSAGFMAGFIAGRPLFGGAGPRGRAGSWDQEVADQQTWEEAVASRAEDLNAGIPPPATGMTPAQQAPGTSPKPPGPAQAEDGTDPVEDYEAWAAQVLDSAESPPEKPPASEQGEAEMPGEAP